MREQTESTKLLIALVALILAFFLLRPVFAVCPVVTEGGTQKTICDQVVAGDTVFDGDATFNGTVNIPGGVTDPSVLRQTTGALTLYVRTGGDDGNDCLASGTACLTIQGAVNKVPYYVNHTVTVDIGAGTFDGFKLIGRELGGTGSLDIFGVIAPPTLGQGTTSGTSTGGDNYSMIASGQNWAVNALRGMFVTVSSTEYLITSNTATTLYIVGRASATLSGKAYVINEIKTLIQEDAGWGPSITIQDVSGGSYPYSQLRRMKTIANGFTMGFLIQNVDLLYLNTLIADTPAFRGLDIFSSKSVSVTACGVLAPTWGGGIVRSVDYLTIRSYFVYGDGSVDASPSMSFQSIDIIDGAYLHAESNGSGNGIEFIDTPQVVAYRITASSNAGSGVTLRNAVFSNSTLTLYGTGNTGHGMRADEFSALIFSGTPTLTGTLGDLTLDKGSSALTWSTDFDEVGDTVINGNLFCRAERK